MIYIKLYWNLVHINHVIIKLKLYVQMNYVVWITMFLLYWIYIATLLCKQMMSKHKYSGARLGGTLQ